MARIMVCRVVTVVWALLAAGPVLGDSPVAPLNGTVSFTSDSAQADTLYVNSGQQTIQATSAVMIQGAANSRITVVTTPGSGTVLVANVTLRSGDSLYQVNGIYLGNGGGSGTPVGWVADYNKGVARIVLSAGHATADDGAVAIGPNGGTLTIWLLGGSSGTNYTVTLSASGNGNPAGNVGFATTSVTLASGGGISIFLSGLAAGYVTITGTSPNATTGTTNATVYAMNQVTVLSGATQQNVTGVKNWAAVKDPNGVAVVEAILTPNVANVPAGLVTWTGGSPVAGQPLQSSVSLATSAMTPVTATIGTSSDYVDVWVVWATITIDSQGQTPANAAQFGTAYDGTETLGAIAYTNAQGASMAVGKVVPYAVITPPGVNAVVAAGWAFKRDKWGHGFADGVAISTRWDTGWVDDTSYSIYLRLTPDANDTIYDSDGPTIGSVGVVNSNERYANFRQYVLWNGLSCSDYAPWYWKAWRQITASPQITMKSVGSGAITLPDTNGSEYKQVSGTITLGGNPLAGVSVSCGGLTATTDANGNYTIMTLEPGGYAMTPAKAGGYTFTPATTIVVVPNNAFLYGQNFSATHP